jgi:hypothetical protein
MDLIIKCDEAKVKTDILTNLQRIEAKKIDNIDEIVESLVDECDPASLVTSSNEDGILDYIGVEYVMKYFDLKQEEEDYGMRNNDFI